MTRTLLTHPYPSVLLKGAVERFTTDMRLIVPNLQAGRDIRGHLQGAGTATTLTQVAREVLRDAGWVPLTPGAREAFLRDALGDVPFSYLEPLRFRSGTLVGLQRLIGELMRARVEPSALLSVAAAGRERDVALAYAAFISRSEEARTFDSVGSEFFASRLPTVRAQRTLMHGFAYLDAAQVALVDRLLAPGSVITLPFAENARGLKRVEETLEALGHCGFAAQSLTGVATLSGDQVVAAYVGGGSAQQAFQREEFSDVEAEVRACLRQVHAWLEEGVRPERLAVVVRSESVYIGALADVAREYQLPLVSGQQVPLLHTPLGGLVQAWVEAHAREWRYSATRRVLTHPLVTLPFDGLAQARALQPGCPGGLAAWHEDFTWLQVPERTTWQEGLGVLQRLLLDLGVRDRCVADPALNVALTLLMDRLQAESRWVGECDREGLLGLVAHVLKTATVPVLLGRSGVRVANPLAALGRRFDAVWVLGLSDTLFPVRTVDHPLIDSVTRRRWATQGVTVPDASTLATVEEALFLGAMAGAGRELVVSRPRRGPDGRELRPSTFWSRIGEGRQDEADALPLGSESERLLAQALTGGALPESVQIKVQVERDRDAGQVGPHAGQLSQPIWASERRWSPSQLHAAGACRYRWFAQKLLRLEEVRDPDQIEDRRVVGTLLHAALEGALTGEQAGDKAEDRIRRAEEVLKQRERALWASGELRGGPLWPIEREEIRRTAVRAIQSPGFVPQGWTPVQLEERREFSVQAGEHTFHLLGIVDRLDRAPDGLTVTDYKTGSYVSKVVQGGALNLEVQLPLYMEALGAVNGRYFSIEKGENLPGGAGPGAEGPRRKYRWEEHRSNVNAFLQGLGEALAQGNVAPSPDHKREACAYCTVRPVCRDRGVEVDA
ncbi:PD-(D/E)XK nuclease family protein [Deinococcus hopiensis]|uniref:PD-(D/E)XK nuclease superfamily protein n=1 Tax=Deinococcus hopiensis KR-140 TaxID=695939 RepID=A0A1W1UN28_9DEIO|nr:PD-(D/E)XK nuclease family protein [Deinococcus hopiensis]SMB82114.1 PD-(D/E)XK nuclease superfamily protein [Deinococcus hopiensis KR-140]